MGNVDQVEIKIGPDLIAPILGAKIQAAIVESIGDPKKFVCEAVNAILRTKVDEKGKRQTYDGYNKHNLMDVMSRTAVTEACEAALKEWFDEHKPLIRDAIKTEITKHPGRITKALIAGMTNAFANNYRLKFEVTIPDE